MFCVVLSKQTYFLLNFVVALDPKKKYQKDKGALLSAKKLQNQEKETPKMSEKERFRTDEEEDKQIVLRKQKH